MTELPRDVRPALTTDDGLIRSAAIMLDTVDPHHPDAQWSMGRYFAELDARFPGGFDHGDALADGAIPLRSPTGAFVVARDGAEPVACGGVQRIDEHTGEIKRMWVAPEWRGAGLGRRMLDRLEACIVELGYRRVVLDTNGSLVEAIAMYERAGYRPIEPYNDNPYAERWFAKLLVDRAP